MTKQELEKKLQKIDRQLEKHHYVEAKKALKQVEQFKPSSLKSIVLSAKYSLMMGDYMEMLHRLDGKWELYYGYEGLDDALQLYEYLWKIESPNESAFRRIEYTRKRIQFIGAETEGAKEIQQNISVLEALSEEFCVTGADFVLMEMEKLTHMISDLVWNYMIQLYFRLTGKTDYLIAEIEWVASSVNMGYIKERMEESGSIFLLVAEKMNESMCRAIGKMLRILDKRVLLLVPPKKMEERFDEEQVLKKSLTSRTLDSCGVEVFETYCIEDGNGQYRDNRAILVDYLSHQTREKLVTVLGSGSLLDDLGMQDCLKQSFTKFSCYAGDLFEDNFSVGWAGHYTSYISKIYNYDVMTSIKAPAECKYSIVIPARNSAESLRYTLKTCLEIDYPKEDYEIVISDNSTNNNMEVYNLCQELQDPRINYYRTPRDLHLPKSFEYAFLQTKGEFILSIGSDDAILPWALKVLDEVRRNYPQEEVIQWERGFYAWPGFNGGQEHQFVIPREYKQNVYHEVYRKSEDYLAQVLKNPDSMYGLPMLYINSGFKRSYMKTLLEKTGRLWDGICQDIYMGVVNVTINKEILNLIYPLTIAGMTSASVGATCAQAHTDDAQLAAFNDDLRKTSNIGGFSMSMIERLLPELRSDVSSLYNSLLRVAARGLLPDSFIWGKLDWKKMFVDVVQKLDIRDMEYDKLIHYARYTASWHGDEFLRWFDDQIYNRVMEPRLVNENQRQQLRSQKTYQEGRTPEGGMVVDASKYGVTNSYGAVQLFQELSGLK